MDFWVVAREKKYSFALIMERHRYVKIRIQKSIHYSSYFKQAYDRKV